MRGGMIDVVRAELCSISDSPLMMPLGKTWRANSRMWYARWRRISCPGFEHKGHVSKTSLSAGLENRSLSAGSCQSANVSAW